MSAAPLARMPSEPRPMSDLAEEHRQEILARMAEQDLSKAELARQAGVNRGSLINFLNGIQADGMGNPSLEWLDRVYVALEK